MERDSNVQTSATLLNRLRQHPADQAAWETFVRKYGKKIFGWCLHWGLQEADAKDVTQTVLLKLSKALQQFDYDPKRSFRAWLKTVSHHAWHDLVTSRQHGLAQGSTDHDKLGSIEARESLSEVLEALWDQEVLQIAMQNVRLRVQPKTWQAFYLTAIEDHSGIEVARQLGLPLATVYKAKSNVIKLLQEEAQNLEQTEYVP